MSFTSLEILKTLGGTAGLVVILKEFYRVYKQRQNATIEKISKSLTDSYKELNYLIQKTGASKAFILYLHNGGDKIQLGKPLYSSISHEVNADGKMVLADKWNKQKIDRVYADLFQKMMSSEDKKVVLYTAKLPDSILKEVYEINEIHHTVGAHIYTFTPKPMRFLGKDKENMHGRTWYMTVVFTDDTPLRDKDIYHIKVARNNLKKIFKEQYKYD